SSRSLRCSRSADRSASRPRERQVDVALLVLHEGGEDAERQPDTLLRLVVLAAHELQAAQADVGLGRERVPVQPTLELRREPALGRLPSDLLEQVRVRSRQRKVSKLAVEIELQRTAERAHGAVERQ